MDAKFSTLVHYIIHKASAPSILGATKLNKVLWLSDVTCFLRTGKAITKQKYIKRQFGPVPADILSTVKALENERKVATRSVDYYGNEKKEYFSLREPDVSEIKPEEIYVIDSVFDDVCHNHTAQSISELSHNRIWRRAEYGEEIPHNAMYFSESGAINEEILLWARDTMDEIKRRDASCSTRG